MDTRPLKVTVWRTQVSVTKDITAGYPMGVVGYERYLVKVPGYKQLPIECLWSPSVTDKYSESAKIAFEILGLTCVQLEVKETTRHTRMFLFEVYKEERE